MRLSRVELLGVSVEVGMSLTVRRMLRESRWRDVRL